MRSKENFKYIYGPVSSWRLGNSLGIDLLSQEAKICSFDCIYCQLGRIINYTTERKLYIPIEEIVEELERLPNVQIDYITFSGRGEPTLAENLGQVIKAVKTLRTEPVAVLTNSSLIDREDVREELNLADFIVVKLDAYSPESLREINRPAKGVEFGNILTGIKQFRKIYTGKMALQIMFTEENKNKAAQLAYLANYIKPDEIQINTPLRSCDIRPLSKEEIFKIKEYFVDKCEFAFDGKKRNIISVYDVKTQRETCPISNTDTLKRRGKI